MSEHRLFIDPLFSEMGKLNAMFKNMAEQMGVNEPAEVIKGINDGSWVVARNEHKWKEEDGVVYFSVVSRSWTIEQWKTYFIGANIGIAANQLFSSANSSKFCYADIEKIEVAVVRGSIKGSEKMEKLAKQRGFVSPRPEIGCLIRDSFTDDEIRNMGFESILVMHEPFSDGGGALNRYLMIDLYYKNIITTSVNFDRNLFANYTGYVYVVGRSQETKSKILEHLATVPVKGADRFVASDHFKVGETDGVKISEIGSNFERNLLGKVENNIPQSDLRIHRLKIDFRDTRIITELGGDEIVETTLAHLWNLLKKQGHGQDGQLQTHGKTNVFYIPDMDGVHWHVSARWFNADHHWCIDSRSTESPRLLKAGSQIISG